MALLFHRPRAFVSRARRFSAAPPSGRKRGFIFRRDLAYFWRCEERRRKRDPLSVYRPTFRRSVFATRHGRTNTFGRDGRGVPRRRRVARHHRACVYLRTRAGRGCKCNRRKRGDQGKPIAVVDANECVNPGSLMILDSVIMHVPNVFVGGKKISQNE